MNAFDVVRKLKDALVRSNVERGSWDEYRELMQSVLDGKDIDPQAAEAICGELGKTLDDLAKDADTFAKRQAWQAEIKAATTNKPKLDAVTEELESIKADHAIAVARFQQRFSELNLQRVELERVVHRLDPARTELRASVQDPKLIFERSEAKRELLDLIDRQRNVRDDLQEVSAPIERAREELRRAKEAYQRSGDREYEAKHLREAKARLEHLEGQREAIVERMGQLDELVKAAQKRCEQVEIRALLP